jgi:hypothetical protein
LCQRRSPKESPRESFGPSEQKLKELFSSGFTLQKLNYIHNDPVEAGIVDKTEEYLYSSARDYFQLARLHLAHIRESGNNCFITIPVHYDLIPYIPLTWCSKTLFRLPAIAFI